MALAVRKQLLYELIDRLDETDHQTVYDFLMYLLDRSRKERMVWERIDETDEEEALTEEERQQLQSDEGYITGGEAKREFGLQVDLP
ncbi:MULTISPECIES: hypothetical protein [Geobacillus]|uniref:XRE family transcriptional regulator n=1 Tax=Geobacillus thermoleovorans CCB_US3_UF5 TaxID=1111068 RepID=A0ABM5MMB6_GEOTH|nr:MULTISPECIES: hypothetical protein [Geobacillus]AEV20783.1 hypothetical protein GTCCBUS3UF5_34820 [Geobacillus thermoleovorans CCB_US3_UF5]EQB96903.1 XRE family transcriptional regulator [Geobacillus sp. A8]MBW7642906.1 hypothetical protein [Geobacillus thermoleovorans]NNU99314.1 hypothetical protein [Geobacillus sp. DSP4a]OQP14448.1 hypothetical protein B1692_03520 [Geobacillus thermoleovorans]